MIILGIDPGKSGAVAALDADTGELTGVAFAPLLPDRGYDVANMLYVIEAMRPSRVWIEMIQVRPKEKRMNCVTMGMGYGFWYAACVNIGVKPRAITSQVWKKVMMPDLDTSNKACSAVGCNRMFDDTRMLRTRSGHKLHDGACDAALIARYGLVSHLLDQRQKEYA